jgi:hypothetical protein
MSSLNVAESGRAVETAGETSREIGPGAMADMCESSGYKAGGFARIVSVTLRLP